MLCQAEWWLPAGNRCLAWLCHSPCAQTDLQNTVDNDTLAGHTMDKENQKPDRNAGHQNCFWWLCPDYTSWVEWDFEIFFNLFKIVPSGAIHIMSSSLWVPSVRECTVVDFIQYVRRALWFDWVHIKQLDQNRLNIKVEIKKKRYSYFSFSSMNHEKVKTNNICVKRSVILSGHVCGTQQ